MFRMFVFIALLGPIPLAAQEQKPYVQVIVTDTVLAPTRRIIYSCSVEGGVSESMFTYTMMNVNASTKEQKKMQEKLQRQRDSACIDQASLNSQLAALGYTLLPDAESDDGYSVSPMDEESCQNAAFVELRSEADLQGLVDFVRSKGNVAGRLAMWERDTRKHDERALERMYTDAFAQAERLAKLAGRKLGPLLAADEAPQNPFSDFLGEEYGRSMERLRSHRSMSFRFALE